MKKILFVIIGAAALAAVGATGYTIYNQKAEAKAFEEKMTQTISSLPPIVVYEKAEIPSIEEEFSGTSDVIDIGSVTPDISNVYTTEPGDYEVVYTFRDVNGVERTATVPCTVKPDLLSHVSGMQDLTIDEGESLPEEVPCTFDDYVSSVMLNAENVDTSTPGIYDISYTILGTGGDMETADGYTCTVNAAAPLPTPTPTPKPTATPTPTATPKPEKTKQEKKKKKETTQTEQEQEQQQPVQTEAPAVGNVATTDTAVETGDTNNILALLALVAASIGSAAGAVIYRKKKNTRK